MKPLTIKIEIPVTILTKKKAPNKTNSIFYSGLNIAKVIIHSREYVLTTSGGYQFCTKEKGKTYDNTSGKTLLSFTRIVNTLTDGKIKHIDREGFIDNWGWFGINVWENNKFISDTATDVYTQYDEALESFIKFVTNDLIKGVLHGSN